MKTVKNDIEKAKALLSGNVSCVLVCGENVYQSTETGIAPMIHFIESGISFNGYSAADKIVGKAAAMLFYKAGIFEVYAEVLSKTALEYLEKKNIPVSYGILTDVIKNRQNTGMCPMELTVAEIEDADDAFIALNKRLKELRKRV